MFIRKIKNKINKYYSNLNFYLNNILKKKFIERSTRINTKYFDLTVPDTKYYKITLKENLEKHQINYWLKRYEALVKFYSFNPDIIIDVGANIGYWSLSSSKIFKKSKFLLFEPLKKSFDLLKKNTQNKSNFELYNFGLGNVDKKEFISFPEWERNSNNLNRFGLMSIYGKTNINREEIVIKKFDDIFNYTNKKIFIKIDVEGSELDVLEGCKKISQLNNVIFEIEINRKIIEFLGDSFFKKLQKTLEKYDKYIFSNNNFKPINNNFIANYIKKGNLDVIVKKKNFDYNSN
jgi:FkbM family methyltransferase